MLDVLQNPIWVLEIFKHTDQGPSDILFSSSEILLKSFWREFYTDYYKL